MGVSMNNKAANNNIKSHCRCGKSIAIGWIGVIKHTAGGTTLNYTQEKACEQEYRHTLCSPRCCSENA